MIHERLQGDPEAGLVHTTEREAQRRGRIIAIDGPARVGKGATAELLRERLGKDAVVYSASPPYRALAWHLLHNPVPFTMSPEGEVISGQEELAAELESVQLTYEDGIVSVNGQMLGEDELRSRDVDLTTPEIAKIALVQEKLIGLRKAKVNELVAAGKTVIVEGRHEGIIFPDAYLKVYLYAHDAMRTRRAVIARMGKDQGIHAGKINADIVWRDTSDMTRPNYPLVSDPENHGYELVDNSLLSLEETVGEIMKEINKKEIEQSNPQG